MAKEEAIKAEGVVIDALPNAQFKVQIDGGHIVLSQVCGKMRQNFIKVMIGDKVEIEISPYDLQRGRIMKRHKE